MKKATKQQPRKYGAQKTHKKPELLAPVGNWAMLSAAIQAGCDAVYFGTKELNMRVTAQNFTCDELKKVVAYCHKHKVRAYLTLNVIVYDNELEEMKRIVAEAKKSKVDAIICWDLSVIQEALQQKIEVHLSTQASVANAQAAVFYKQLGISRIVLARECTLEQITAIKEKVNVEIECFVHGAMCVSLSGRCFMSQFLYGKSANRGECLQPCRRSYDASLITDQETKKELQLENHYVMSAKDLCTLPFLDKLIAASIDVFKIEGRGRSPEYVKTVVSCYREAIDAHAAGRFTPRLVNKLIAKVKTVYHREFSNGFYMGVPINAFTDGPGNKATTTKEYIGKVCNYYKQKKVADVLVESGTLEIGDSVLIIGDTTGVVEQKVTSMHLNKRRATIANKGEHIGLQTKSLVRARDRVYKVIPSSE